MYINIRYLIQIMFGDKRNIGNGSVDESKN